MGFALFDLFENQSAQIAAELQLLFRMVPFQMFRQVPMSFVRLGDWCTNPAKEFLPNGIQKWNPQDVVHSVLPLLVFPTFGTFAVIPFISLFSLSLFSIHTFSLFSFSVHICISCSLPPSLGGGGGDSSPSSVLVCQHVEIWSMGG